MRDRALRGEVRASGVFLLRRVASPDELHEVVAVIGAQFDPPVSPPDRRIDRILDDFPTSRHMMLVAERGGDVVGGVLGFQDGGSAGIRIIGFEPSVRGTGLARRMMQIVEVEASARGARRIDVGTSRAAKGFYERLGYQGRKHAMHKALPLPGRSVRHRVAGWLAEIGDLETGVPVRIDPGTGRVPDVF